MPDQRATDRRLEDKVLADLVARVERLEERQSALAAQGEEHDGALYALRDQHERLSKSVVGYMTRTEGSVLLTNGLIMDVLTKLDRAVAFIDRMEREANGRGR